MMAGANMMQAGGPSLAPRNFGTAFGSGMEGLVQGALLQRKQQQDEEEAKAMQAYRDALMAGKGQSSAPHLLNTQVVMGKNGQPVIVGFNSDASTKEFTDYQPMIPQKSIDTGGEILQVPAKAPWGMPTQPVAPIAPMSAQPIPQSPSVINTGVPYTPEELNAIQQDFANQGKAKVPFPMGPIKKEMSPAQKAQLALSERGQQRADTQLGLSMEDQQMQRERLAMDKQAKEQQMKRDVPSAMQTAFIANNDAMRKIDQAIQAIDSDPGALGAINYLPDALIQRVDPEGVDVRSKIAEVGAAKIHDLSGAAVSESEAKRLKAFVPKPDDNPDAAIKKLLNLRKQYEYHNSGLSFGFYIGIYIFRFCVI